MGFTGTRPAHSLMDVPVGHDAAVPDIDANLDAISTHEPAVRAWVCRHDNETIRQAVSEAELAAPGPLAGWTLGVKDVIDTIDLPTERGSAIYPGRRTVNDAPCVALAKQAGAVVVGKAATTEFALFTPTVTTNPHNPDHTPGGSSSGSAAAVAAGMVRTAFGTQTVGSVIRPAAFCGVVGFKPTHQLIPLTGVATLAQSLDTLGWFTKTVDDAVQVHRALAGPGSATAPDRPLKLGLYRSAQWEAAQPEMDGVLTRAAEAVRDSGMTIEDVEPLAHLDGVFDAAHVILQFEMARVFEWERRHYWEKISPLVQKMLTRSDSVTSAHYGEAQTTVQSARAAHDQWMIDQGFDALLTPSSPGEAPPLATTGDSVFNRTWSALGVPCLHQPMELGEHELPLGVQLTGRRWADDELLGVGLALEGALCPNGIPTP